MTLQMGIVKVEIKIPELVRAVEVFKENNQKFFELISSEIKHSVGHAFNKILQAEFDLFLGTADQSTNKRNGFREREFAIKGVGCIRIRIPRDRHQKFSSQIIPKHEQVDSRLKEDLAVLHLAGISNRTLSMISKRILGVEMSPQSVHNSLAIVEEKALGWLERKLDKNYWCLFVDGTNFKIQRRGSTELEPTLVVVGIDATNCTSLLALQAGQKDNAESWQVVFEDLVKRGLRTNQVQIGVMDGLPGLETKFKEFFPQSTTGRCWVHAKRNAVQKCAARLRLPFENLLIKVMYATSESQARLKFNELKKAMGPDCERATRCIEKDLESLLVHYKFEKRFWRALKTTNPIERVNKELKRRTKSMEGLGEKTLNILLAFTAMRLEYNWQRIPVDSKQLNNLEHIANKNQIEHVLENLIH
ncbi:MAG: IS256 family transposase [Nitrosomonas sp.]|nr:IS256 family transposase [Nitrosomonas sp.]